MNTTVLNYFLQIAQIPRPSGQEEQIRKRLCAVAEHQQRSTQIDTTGNLLVRVPATAGYENNPTIILQAHMDMVCVKAPDTFHDFTSDPIDIQTDNGRIHANGTTLGADNGIGMAMMLAVTEQPHPPLELLFTVDEERGLVGALGLDASMLTGNYLINLDSEDEGEVCIASAGGARLDIEANLATDSPDSPAYRLTLDGLQGGHSGVEIHQNRGNALRWLLHGLDSADQSVQLATIEGGMADNAIPAAAEMVVCTDQIAQLQEHLSQQINELQANHNAPDATLTVIATDQPQHALTATDSFLHTINAIPEGVQRRHPRIDDLVETSINLGIVSLAEGKFTATHAARSSDTDQMNQLINQVVNSYEQDDFDVTVRNRYPGWSQDPNDQLVQETVDCYAEALGKQEPTIVAYHAGLECGAIVGKVDYPLQAVSIGPTIEQPHSVNERCKIDTIDTTFTTLVKLITRLA